MLEKICTSSHALAYASWHCTLGHKVEVIQVPRSFSQFVMERVWSTLSKSVMHGIGW